MSAPPLPLAIGALLAGKYRIDAVLGQGGMGAVFAAENVDLGRAVAIKVLHGDLARDQGLVKRFRQEARAAAAIGHPGIVDVLDLGTTEDGDPFIVMERLDGESLGARLVRQNRLPVADAVAIVVEALDALAAAHAKGIVHRDLKPDNLFLVARPSPAVKLVDFGISKLQGADDVGLTATGVVMGTPLYMSPEQARGARDIGTATDLYSIGAILYQALCGEPPLNGTSYNELIAKLVTEEPVPLASRRSGLPPALTELVQRLLDKDPEARPSATETRDALGAVELPIGADSATALAATAAPAPTPPSSVAFGATMASAPPPPLGVAPPPRPRRARALAIVVAVIAAIGLAVIAYVGFGGSDGARPAPVHIPPDAGAAARIPPDAAARPPDASPPPPPPPLPPIDASAAPDAGRSPHVRAPKKHVDAGVGSASGTSDDGLSIDEQSPIAPKHK